MKIRAAISWEPQQPLAVEEIDLDGPKSGECLVRLVATGVCHTDAYTMSGRDPSGLFPSVLGHEGGGIVEEVGPGVTSLAVGDHVIPLYIPECRNCEFCLSGKTNLCSALLATQGKGLMPDGSSRLSYRGQRLGIDEIRACHRDLGGDLDAMVDRLRVSKPALRRRIQELGLA